MIAIFEIIKFILTIAPTLVSTVLEIIKLLKNKETREVTKNTTSELKAAVKHFRTTKDKEQLVAAVSNVYKNLKDS